MRISLERQSVSMRDDRKAPNRQTFEVMGNIRLKSFIEILSKNYCPKVNDEKEIWVLWDKHKAVAIFDSISYTGKYFYNKDLAMKEVVNGEEEAEMYLYYRGNANINDVYEELQEELIG